MAFFSVDCPRCNRATIIGIDGRCTNLTNHGDVCGFELPIKYLGGNSFFRRKFAKHTNPPPEGTTKDLSWVSHSGDYSSHQEFTLASGSVHLDPQNKYLFLWSTPSQDQPIARLFYGDSGTIGAASGVIMPLNSKIGNVHHFYGNYQPHFETIAQGTGLVIESPNALHTDFRILDRPGGNPIYIYDPTTNSGRRIDNCEVRPAPEKPRDQEPEGDA